MKTRTKFEQIQNDIKFCNLPYNLDRELIQKDLDWLVNWQKDSQNDCLRARGDWRWLKSLELESELKALLRPF